MELEGLLDYRKRKDEFFRSVRSPLPGRLRGMFTGLAYFPPNPALVFETVLEPDPAREAVVMQTSDNAQKVYERHGWVTFSVDGQALRLGMFAPEGTDHPEAFFVPFRDATSGKETYGAGRYLEAHTNGQHVRLDFNLAYSPYCAYAEGWSCPIPPVENWLSVPIHAGEKLLNLEAHD